MLHIVLLTSLHFFGSNESCCSLNGLFPLLYISSAIIARLHCPIGIALHLVFFYNCSAYPSIDMLNRQGLADDCWGLPLVTYPVALVSSPAVFTNIGCSAFAVVPSMFSDRRGMSSFMSISSETRSQGRL